MSEYLPKILVGVEKPLCIDVGANVGRYTAMLRHALPQAKVIALEPAAKPFAALKHRHEGDEMVLPLQMGVSSRSETLQLFSPLDEKKGGHASVLPEVLTELHQYKDIEEQTINLTTLDALAAEQDILKIDFLKIDIEGYELEALKGAQSLLEQKKIGVIQIEFNEMNVISRVFLKDYYDLLGKAYTFYRIRRDHGLLPLGSYWAGNEVFHFQNLVLLPSQENVNNF